MKAEQAIGVFDSGVGGLSVLRHIREQLPNENLIYVADSAYMPYGCKPRAEVEARCMHIADFFSERGCKAIVVACNTATAAAIHRLRTLFDIPVIGMEPGVKPAVEQSKTGVIGVLATTGTLSSDKFEQLKQRFAGDATLIVQPCPGLVEQIEQGELEGDGLMQSLGHLVTPLIEAGADTLVLGCTHYPFIASQIRQIAGDNVAIIDTGEAIARELKRQLEQRGLLSKEAESSVEFRSSGEPFRAEYMISRLWGEKVAPGQFPNH